MADYEGKAADYEGMTLAEALDHAEETRWPPGGRYHVNAMSQARLALATLTEIVRPDLAELPPPERNRRIMHADVEPRHLRACVKTWRGEGKLSASTINKRVVALSVLGYVTVNLYTTRPKVLKWWLKPDVEAKLTALLRQLGETLMADYVNWATTTGLRVEESLRLERRDFSELPSGRVVMTVPGLKTGEAQATLPLAPDAEAIFRRRLGDAAPRQRLFDISYQRLGRRWDACRLLIGADQPTATLKALRRSAARKLHVGKGMPLDMVRHYLRHEGIATTMGYLRLTGGYGADEYDRYL